MKKYLLMLFAIFLYGAMAQAADPELALSGDGTEANPYLLTSKADIKALADACNTDATSTAGHYSGKYFKVTTDIDMENDDTFEGIGRAVGKNTSSSWYFGGVIDGDGHTIKNMKLNGVAFNDDGSVKSVSATGSKSYMGFVCYLKGTSTAPAAVKNLNFEGSDVAAYDYAGTAVGYANSYSTISNIKVNGNVSAYNTYGGGVVGYAYKATTSKISDCLFKGKVKNYKSYAGGIAAYAGCDVENCVNMGSVEISNFFGQSTSSSRNYIGGIAGYTTASVVKNCLNAGKVKSLGGYVGGLVGYANYTTSLGSVENCVNLGAMELSEGNAATTVGFLVGHLSSTTVEMLKNCYYDNQLFPTTSIADAKENAGAHGLGTKVITAGTALDGLDAAVWTFAAGSYPVPTAFAADETVKAAASTYFELPEGETAENFKTTATLSAGVTASLKVGKTFEIADGKILSKEVTGNDIEKDVLTLTKGDYTMDYALAKSPKFFDGEGTAENPYLIKDKQSMLNLAKLTSAEKEHFSGVYFKQVADIDMENDETFHGIAYMGGVQYPERQVYFAGTYDGGGYAIKNVKIKNNVLSEAGSALAGSNGGTENSGLFCTVGGATIKNVHLAAGSEIDGYKNVGGIVGYALANTLVDNCVNEASVTSYYTDAAGIVAYVPSSATNVVVKNCVNKGAVVANNYNAAGIVSFNYASIDNCLNEGPVAAKYINPAANEGSAHNAGGIVAQNYSTITNSQNVGSVYADKGQAGGIVGAAGTKGAVKASVSLGHVWTGTGTQAAAIVCQTGNDLENAYFDAQLSGLNALVSTNPEGAKPMLTSEFTSAKTLEGLADSAWVVKEGYYPVLKAYEAEAILQAAASTYVTMAKSESSSNFKTTATLSTTAKNVEVTFAKGNKFTYANGVVTALDVTEVEKDTMYMKNGDYTMVIALQKVPNVLPGSGTEADPYQIKTAEDYCKIGKQMADASYAFAGEYFKVLNDIDFKDKEFVAIGTADVPFQGVLDGGNFALKNVVDTVTIDDDMDVTNQNLAMVRYLGGEGVVKNLKVEGCQLRGYNNVAAIVAQNDGLVENCQVSEDSKIEALASSPTANGVRAGGIVAMANAGSKVVKCVNKAAVTARQVAGGIVGGSNTSSTESTIEECENYGEITANFPVTTRTTSTGQRDSVRTNSAEAGGIVGRFLGKVTACVNYGKVNVPFCTNAGGIAGQAYAGTTVDTSKNYGEVFAKYDYAGGIVGLTQGSNTGGVTITNCYNGAKVVSDSYHAAGIAAKAAAKALVSGCGNEGDIAAGENYAAGVVAVADGADIKVEKSWNGGKIKAGTEDRESSFNNSAYSGGIVGSVGLNMLTIDRCFNVGEVTTIAGWGYVGGIVGLGFTDMTNSYNAGKVSAESYLGGVTGNASSNSTQISKFEKVYNIGEVNLFNAANAQNAGNVIGNGNDNYGMTADKSYCLSSLTAFHNDTVFGVNALPLKELHNSQALLGDAYVYNDYAFPMIAGLDTLAAAKVFASSYELAEGDTEDKVTGTIKLSKLDGVEWTAGGALGLWDGDASTYSIGEGTLTATCGKYSKTFKFNVTQATAVDSKVAAKTVKSVKYYNVAGVESAEPFVGVNVVVTTYTDGTKATAKRVIK